MCQHDGEDGDLPVGARFCSGWHPVCRMAVPRIVFHCCNKGVEAQAARTGTVGVADRLPLSFREIRYDLGFIAALDFNRTLMILTMKNSNLKDRMLNMLLVLVLARQELFHTLFHIVKYFYSIFSFQSGLYCHGK